MYTRFEMRFTFEMTRTTTTQVSRRRLTTTTQTVIVCSFEDCTYLEDGASLDENCPSEKVCGEDGNCTSTPLWGFYQVVCNMPSEVGGYAGDWDFKLEMTYDYTTSQALGLAKETPPARNMNTPRKKLSTQVSDDPDHHQALSRSSRAFPSCAALGSAPSAFTRTLSTMISCASTAGMETERTHSGVGGTV